MNMRKPITVISSVILAAIFSGSAYADTFIVNFNKIEVTDDGDGRNRGPGEITFFVSANGKDVYNKYKVVSDSGNSRFIPLNISKEILTSVGVSIQVNGTEYDKKRKVWGISLNPSGANETCRGYITHKKNDLGAKQLKCEKGGMSYILHYFIDKY